MRAATAALGLVLMTSLCGLAAAQGTSQSPDWLGGVWRWGYHDIGPQWFVNMGPDSAKLVATSMAQAGAAGLVVRIQDPTGPSWRTAYEGRPEFLKNRDLVSELSAACRERHLRFLGYIWALADKPAWDAHPDWRIVSPAGAPVGEVVCCNSPYRDLVRRRLVELARGYPDLHGIFFDMFHWHRAGCYCRFCREKFHALTGQDPPATEDPESPLWRRWDDFQLRSIEAALQDWRTAVRDVRPDFALIANTWGGWVSCDPGFGGSSVRVADTLDGTVEEQGWYWGAGSASFFGFPQRWPFMNLYLRSIGDNAAGPGRCVAHMWEAGNVPPALSAPLPVTEVIARVADMVTFGVHPWPYFRRGPEGMKPVFDFIRDREPWLTGAHLAPWCALVVSESTQFWYGRREPIPRYLQGIHGVLRTLWEQHLPVEIITDEDLERRDLAAYPVLLLANTACVSAVAAGRLREYVKAGGGLVATYESALYDEAGTKREDFAVGDVLGAKYVSPGQPPVYLDLAAGQSVLTPPTQALLGANVDDLTGKPQGGMAFPAGAVVARPLGSGEVALNLHCLGSDKAALNAPGLIAAHYGEGRAVYLPADVGKSAFFCNLEYVDRILADALRWAAKRAPPVEVTAPRTVIAVPQRQGRRLLVHLLNDYSSLGRASVVKPDSIALRHEVLPVRGIELTFTTGHWTRFTLQPGGQTLVAKRSPTGPRVTVPEVGWHAIVVAEP